MTTNQQKKTSVRNANIELLRIISALCILMGHMTYQAGFNYCQPTVNSVLISLLCTAGNITVNLFLMIGAFYMTDARFSGKRIVTIWSQLFFYSSLITVLVILLGFPVSPLNIIKGFFPFTARALWFVTAYLTLILAVPFLNKVFLWKKEQQFLFLVILFAAICLVSTIPGEERVYLSDSFWFWFVYLAIGYYKKHIFGSEGFLRKHSGLLFAGAVLLYLIMCLSYHFSSVCESASPLLHALQQITFQYLSDIKCLPIAFCAFVVFNFVIQKKETSSKAIQALASSSFSVYIIHQIPAFIPVLWTRICRIEILREEPWSVRYMILLAVSIYAAVSLIDIPRRMLEKRWVRTSLFRKLSDAVEKPYRKASLLE